MPSPQPEELAKVERIFVRAVAQEFEDGFSGTGTGGVPADFPMDEGHLADSQEWRGGLHLEAAIHPPGAKVVAQGVDYERVIRGLGARDLDRKIVKSS
jgi:hypothetical protein